MADSTDAEDAAPPADQSLQTCDIENLGDCMAYTISGFVTEKEEQQKKMKQKKKGELDTQQTSVSVR